MVNERTDKLKTANAELKKALKKAEETSRAKSEFLDDMSHEIRTPIHGILSFCNFGMEKYDTVDKERILHYFTKIDGCAKRLLTLVNNLLELAKLEAGKIEYDFHDISLSLVVRTVVEELDAYAKERNVSIQFDEPNFDNTVKIDSARISQATAHLVSNAIKFSNEGAEIRLELANETDSIVFSVIDIGIGISEEERDRIFDRFVQGRDTKSHRGGAGMGLPICRQIVKDHCGHIWAESNAPKGSIFKFAIPKSTPKR